MYCDNINTIDEIIEKIRNEACFLRNDKSTFLNWKSDNDNTTKV